MKRRVFAAGLFAAPFAKPAFAQSWSPSAPIRLVVAYPAGGPTDVIARIVASDIAGPLGLQVVVENLSGGAGAIGTRVVAKTTLDGLTITFGNNQTHGNNMFMLRDPGYDAVKDFAPLAGAGAFEHVFVVRNDLPAQTIGSVNGDRVYSFEVEPFRKYCLVNGLDDIGLTLRHAEKIREFEAKRLKEQPWLAKTLQS